MGDRQRLTLMVSERTRVGRQSATVERLDKLPKDGVETLHDQRQRVIAGTVDRMHRSGQLEHREYWAADTFSRTYYDAEIDGYPRSSDLERSSNGNGASPPPSMWRSQTVADARGKWRAVENAFDRRGLVWRLLMAAVIDELGLESIGHNVFRCGDRREARAAGRAGVKTALAALADHYGI